MSLLKTVVSNIEKEKMLEKKLDISKIDSYIIQLRKKIKNT